MQVKREVTSYDTNVSSDSNITSLTLLAKPCEFWLWCVVFPTRGTKMVAKCLAVLYEIELMLLLMGLSVYLGESVNAGHGFAWVQAVKQCTVNYLVLL